MNLSPPISLSHSLKTSRYRFRFLFPGHFPPPSALHLLTAANSCRGPPAASLAPTDFKRLFFQPTRNNVQFGKVHRAYAGMCRLPEPLQTPRLECCPNDAATRQRQTTAEAPEDRGLDVQNKSMSSQVAFKRERLNWNPIFLYFPVSCMWFLLHSSFFSLILPVHHSAFNN